MLLVKKAVLSACLTAARAAFPNESMLLLTGRRLEKKEPAIGGQKDDLLLEGVTVPAGLSVNSHSANYSSWQLPPAIEHVGVFHSHPSFSNRPSRADVFFASKEGGVSLIACQPFSVDDLKAYDSSGQPIVFKTV